VFGMVSLNHQEKQDLSFGLCKPSNEFREINALARLLAFSTTVKRSQ